jgi:hypothetical protein
MSLVMANHIRMDSEITWNNSQVITSPIFRTPKPWVSATGPRAAEMPPTTWQWSPLLIGELWGHDQVIYYINQLMSCFVRMSFSLPCLIARGDIKTLQVKVMLDFLKSGRLQIFPGTWKLLTSARQKDIFPASAGCMQIVYLRYPCRGPMVLPDRIPLSNVSRAESYPWTSCGGSSTSWA